MKSNSYKLLAVIALAVIFSACTPMAKLIKSQDSEAMYQYALKMYQEKKNEKAIALFDMVEYPFSGTARHDTIQFYTAVSHYRRKDYFTSNELLQEFRRQYLRGPFLEETEYLIAMGYYHLSPAPELDQVPTQMAIAQFTEYLNRYPNSVKFEEVRDNIRVLQQKLYDKSFLNAKLYYDIENYKSAIWTFKQALKEYPQTSRREEILYLLTKASYTYAENSLESLQRGRYLEMLDAYYNLVSEYPETKYLKEAKAMYDHVQSTLKERYSDDETLGQEIEAVSE
jgi:outer membrane protein assembly factor BamD